MGMIALNKKPNTKKNYIYNTLYQAVAMLIPIVTAPYLARIFGPDGVGICSYTSSISSIFILLATFGTASYGQREVAMVRDNREKASQTFWEIEMINIIITCICLLLWFVFTIFSTRYTTLFLVLSLQIVAVIFDISWLYAAYEDFKTIMVRNTIVKLIGLIITFILVKDYNDLFLYLLIISLTTLIGNVSTWIKISKLVDMPKLKLLKLNNHFKQTFIYFVPALATSVYTVLDKTMIGYITKNELENGYYEQATKIINIAKTLVFSFNTIMYARMSYIFAKKDINKLKQNLETSLDFICLISIPLSFGVAAISNKFVPWFFGAGYEPAILLIYLLSPLVFIIGISNFISTQCLTPIGKRKESSKAIIAGAIVNFILNSVLIYFFKSIGAVIATMVAELLITVTFIVMAKEYIPFKNICEHSYKKIIAALLMSIIITIVGNYLSATIITTVIQIFIGIIIYFLTLFILKDNFIQNIKKM